MAIEIKGICDERLSVVRDAFEQGFEDGLEIGASLCVTLEGENVLDLWAGHRDRKREHPWQEDTIGLIASTTKIAAALCALMEVDRGHLELDAPVAEYWPEFATAGKAGVTVRHVLTQTSGVPGLTTPVPQRTLSDWDAVIRLIENEPLWYEPGTAWVYHPLHYGFMLGELVRRTSGKRPAQFLRDEVTSKIGADFSIGVASEADVGRLAEWIPTGARAPATDLMRRVVASYSLDPEPTSWESLSRENPSGNGWTNGRGVARLCAVFANRGTLEGVRLLSLDTVEAAGSVQFEGETAIFGHLRYGLGFGLHSAEFPAPTETAFHWGGAGGSWGLMDPKRRISAGYVMNHAIFEGGPHYDPRQARIWAALGDVMPRIAD